MTARGRFPRRGIRLAALGLGLGCSDAPITQPAGFDPPTAQTTITLAPGAFTTLTGRQAVEPIEFPEADRTQVYVVAVQNASGLPGTEQTIRIAVQEIRPIGSADRIRGPNALRPGRLAPARTPRARGPVGPLDGWYDEGEARFRDEVTRAVRGSMVRSAVRRSAPVVGQTLQLRSPVEADGTLSTCSSTATLTGVVRAVGPHFAIVEDTAVAGELTASDYADFLAEMESAVVPIGEAYFGTPDDVDGNGVVIALVSAAVNRLGAAGFFTPSDLASAADCPASNEGEVLWLIGPDGSGDHGEPVPPGLVRDRLVGIVAHELQHLVHAQRRAAAAGGDLTAADVPWVNEGLSHIAEEVTGLYAGGLRTGSNLSFDDLGQLDVNRRFRTYHLSVFRFLRDYLESTINVPAIVDEPVTRGALRRARGFGYLFLRWTADQFAADGAPGLVGSLREEEFFRSLTLGGPAVLRSTDNVRQALAALTGSSLTWDELFALYAAVPAVDDITEAEVPLAASLSIETWNLPAAYENARDNGFDLDFPTGFPLLPQLLVLTELPTNGFATELELLPSTAAYLRFESPMRTPRARLLLLDPSGLPLDPDRSLQVTIVRAF